jgi:hypothetical protein
MLTRGTNTISEGKCEQEMAIIHCEQKKTKEGESSKA